MSQGLIFSRSPLSHLVRQDKYHLYKPYNVEDDNHLFSWTLMKIDCWYIMFEGSTPPDVLHCVALKQAVWILQLQRLLVLHRAEPPGVVDDAAEPQTWGEQSKMGSEHTHNNERKCWDIPFRTLTWLPVVLFSLVIKLQQDQEIYDIRHVVVPLDCGKESGVKFVRFNVHSVIL